MDLDASFSACGDMKLTRLHCRVMRFLVLGIHSYLETIPLMAVRS